MPEHYSDKELLELFRNGDNPNYAFNLVIRKYQEKTYWHVRRLVIDHDDANDIIQDIFIKVWKGLPRFRGESELFTWIYRIATNETLNFLNRKKRRFFVPLGDVENTLQLKILNNQSFSGNEIERKLYSSILKLPEKQRIVFNMRYFDQLSYQEISDILGTSVGALKASYHHAAKKVEEYILNH